MKRPERLLIYANRLLFVIAFVLWSVVATSLVLTFVPYILRLDVFVGWFRYYWVLTGIIITASLFSVIPIFLSYLIISFIYGWYSNKASDMRIGARAVWIVLWTNVFMGICSFFGFIFVGYERTLQNVMFNDRLYHLTIASHDPAEGIFFYQLSECDSLDFVCREIYFAEQYWIEQDVGEITQGEEILVTYPTTNTITLQINGETVFTHRVE